MFDGEVRAGRADADAEAQRGARSLDVDTPVDPGRPEQGGLINPPCLVRVDRYGSVSGLVRVRTPLGMLILKEVKPGRQTWVVPQFDLSSWEASGGPENS